MRNPIKTLFFLIILSISFSTLTAQDGGAILPTGGEAAAIQSALLQNSTNGSIILNSDTSKEVSKQTEMLLEAEKAKEMMDKKKDDLKNGDADDDDDKIVNIRSDDFLREITMSTKGYYSYDLFYTSKGFKMESSMTSYSDYQVGPGDEIVLSMWGDVELRKTLKVSKDGTIYLDNVGLVTVNGYKLDALELKLKKLLAKAYITLEPSSGEASTYLDVSLGKLKPITVFLVGEVFKQGAIKLDSYSTVFTALYNAGGPTARGTLRNIQVVRNGKVVSTIDIYDYLLTGRKVDDIILKNNDNILVQPRYSSIKLKGEVNNEKIYELKENEDLSDLIKYSGGVKITSSLQRVQVERIIPFKDRSKELMYSKEIKEFKFGNIVKGNVVINPVKLEDGDIVSVFPISDIVINYVNIQGAVILPGQYSLEPNMTVANLISKTGGLLPEAYLTKGEIIRTHPDLSTELIDIDLTKKEYLNFRLESADKVKIYSNWEIFTRHWVEISGHIKKPGVYSLSDSTKVADLIFQSGSLRDPDYVKETYLERADLIRYDEDGIKTRIIPIDLRKLLDGDESENILLKHKDHLKIYQIDVIKLPEDVTINGFVKTPGKYKLQTNMGVEDLILQANGFLEGALYYEAEVFRVDPYNIQPEKLVSVHKVSIDKNFFDKGRSPKNKFLLQNKDKVVIREYPDFQYHRSVTLNGEVKFPGNYSLQKEKETLAELIERAGGLKNEAFTDGISFTRDSMNVLSNFGNVKKGSKGGDFVLQHGDVINIPKHPGVVQVEGFVFSPGLVKFTKGWDLQDYVDAAGGVMVDDNYEEGETVVYYPGGAAEVDGWLFSPSVKEGSRIVVKRSKIPEEKDGTTLKEWVAIIASIVSISYYLTN
ncbi:MAG: SLBB domain-containing protein [Candidatus Delongbacteria bacterium]|nr:SLBB domain-containing protein [Candidatus Delongbacteria bacterium]